MKQLTRLILIILLIAGFSGYDSRIASANFSKSEILTEQENLDLCKIFSADKINRIDSLISVYSTRFRFNGNILVAINGYNVVQRSVGYADPINRIEAKPETIYQLASISKQFTAAAIMLLELDGKLSFDDHLIKFIPELPYEKVTLRHLLHHTGGLPNYMYLTDRYWEGSTPPDNEDVIELMARYKLSAFFQPGSRYDYSNTGYVMLATVVERISGMSLNEFLQRRVFKPLGMNSTYVYSTADTSIKRRHIDGFRASRSGFTRISDTKNNGPVGDKGVCSTSGDMFKWDRALHMGSPINKEMLEEAFSPVKTTNGREVPYGYGFRIKEFNSEKVIYHNGLWEGSRTNFHRYLDSQNTIIVLNNTSIRTNHELVRQIESVIGDCKESGFTEMIAKAAIEEGVEPALELYYEVLDSNPDLEVDFDKIAAVADYLQKAGKTEKASELEKLYAIGREVSGI
ncbi:MAG: beta-lactamase family protein [Bacteroidales bacterium]|nr:beta-lactamase family protein [Bacteroidales bacterium]MBK9356864.1 beta-lactamase family protein [Bacteroidales bacterium]